MPLYLAFVLVRVVPMAEPCDTSMVIKTQAYNAYNYWKVRKALQRGELQR